MSRRAVVALVMAAVTVVQLLYLRHVRQERDEWQRRAETCGQWLVH